MEFGDLIDLYAQMVDEVKDVTTMSAYDRLKIRERGQRAFDMLWLAGDWPFRVKQSTLLFPATLGVAAAPTDFLGFGDACGLYRDVKQPPLAWMPLREILDEQIRTGNKGTRPEYFSVGNREVTGLEYIYIFPVNPADQIMPIIYERIAPILLDKRTSDLPGTPSGLAIIPAQFHRTVLYEMMVWKGMLDVGSAEAQAQEQLVMLGLNQMKSQLRPGRSHPHFLPPSRSGRFPLRLTGNRIRRF